MLSIVNSCNLIGIDGFIVNVEVDITRGMPCFNIVGLASIEIKEAKERVKSAISYMPIVSCELPYEGAKEMLLVDEVDNKEFLTGLFHAMYDELPTPKPKKKK